MTNQITVLVLYYLLLCLQLHAPGCPVIIIGTHRDKVSKKIAIELEEKVLQKYSNNENYPQVSITIEMHAGCNYYALNLLCLHVYAPLPHYMHAEDVLMLVSA